MQSRKGHGKNQGAIEYRVLLLPTQAPVGEIYWSHYILSRPLVFLIFPLFID